MFIRGVALLLTQEIIVDICYKKAVGYKTEGRKKSVKERHLDSKLKLI